MFSPQQEVVLDGELSLNLNIDGEMSLDLHMDGEVGTCPKNLNCERRYNLVNT